MRPLFDALVSLTMTVTAMTLLIGLAESLLPKGPVRSTMRLAAGLLYLQILLRQITVIFGGSGV